MILRGYFTQGVEAVKFTVRHAYLALTRHNACQIRRFLWLSIKAGMSYNHWLIDQGGCKCMLTVFIVFMKI